MYAHLAQWAEYGRDVATPVQERLRATVVPVGGGSHGGRRYKTESWTGIPSHRFTAGERPIGPTSLLTRWSIGKPGREARPWRLHRPRYLRYTTRN